MSAQRKLLKSVSVEVLKYDDEIVCELGLFTETDLTAYVMSREGAERIMQALTNYIDILEGRQPRYPGVPAS